MGSELLLLLMSNVTNARKTYLRIEIKTAAGKPVTLISDEDHLLGIAEESGIRQTTARTLAELFTREQLEDIFARQIPPSIIFDDERQKLSAAVVTCAASSLALGKR